jgi:hypothetical protein
MPNPKDARQEIASQQNQLTLQKLARRNPAGFIFAVVAIIGAICIIAQSLYMMAFALAITKAAVMTLALGLLLLGGTVAILSMSMFGPRGLLSKNRSHALENAELSTLSMDELHALCDFQREQGNIAEAERISKHLLNLAESDSAI